MSCLFFLGVIQGDSETGAASCPDLRSSEGSAHKPSAFYFRRDLRQIHEPERLRTLGLEIVEEHERLMAWVVDQGLEPPQWIVAPDEAREKRLETT